MNEREIKVEIFENEGTGGTMVASLATTPTTAATTTPSLNGGLPSPSEPDVDAIKMFVGQIPRHWNEPDCRRLFEQFGPVHSCNILRDKQSQTSKGCCFVTFYHRKDAIDAQGALHNIKIIEGMHHPVQMKPADTENRNERKLFVGQLSKRHTEDDVRHLFSRFGPIEDCSVLRDQDGKSRGCAFVTYATRSCAMVATKEMHHSQTMEGCSAPLVVKFADTQKDKDVKQKAALVGGVAAAIAGVTSPTPTSQNSGLAALANLNPNLLQQLGGGTQNVNAIASLLTLLGGGAAPAAHQQQTNLLGLLGNILSNLATLTDNTTTSTNASVTSSSTITTSASAPSSQQTASVVASANAPIMSHHQHQSLSVPQPQPQQPLAALLPQQPQSIEALAQLQQAQLAAQQNQFLALQSLQQPQVQHTVQVSQNGTHTSTSKSLSTTSTTSSLNSYQHSPPDEDNNKVAAAMATHPQLLYLNHQSFYPFSAAAAPFGLAGGLAAVKTTSPVAATLATHTPTMATLGAFGAANTAAQFDPYQAAALQQYALLANLQATQTAVPLVGNGDVKGPDGANLFIYHLPQDFVDADLHNTFSPFGTVLSAKVFIDKVTNLSKCFGFVSFDNATSAANAIQAMNGFQIGSKRLKVQLKADRGNPYQKEY